MSAIVEMRPAEYARHRGCSRVAVGKAIEVGRIPALAIRTDAAGVKWIDVAAADLAWPASIVRVNSSASDIAGAFSSSSVPEENAAAVETAAPGLTRARTEAAQIETRLKELQLRKQLGELVEVADVVRAMERCAELLARDVDQLHSRADDLVTAYTRSGEAGLRSLLKEISRGMRETISNNMRLLAAEDDGDADAAEAVDQAAQTTEVAA